MDRLPFEVINIISSFQDKVSDASKLRRTCKQYMKLKLTPRVNDNSLLILIQRLYSRFSIIMSQVSKYITWDIVCRYPEWNWDYQGLSANPNITMDIINNNPQIPWCYYTMSSNPNIDIEYVIDHLNEKQFVDTIHLHNKDLCSKDEIEDDGFGWDFYTLSFNKAITPQIVKKYPNLPWNIQRLNVNPNFHMTDLEELGIFKIYHFVYNQNINESDALRLISYDGSVLFQNLNIKNLSIDFILSYPDLDWDWGKVSFLPGVTIEHINKYPNKKWNRIYFNLPSGDISELDHNQQAIESFVHSDFSKYPNIKHELAKHIDCKPTPDIKAEFIPLFLSVIIESLLKNNTIPIDIILDLFSEGDLESINRVIQFNNIKKILYSRKDINWNTVLSHPNINWDYELLCNI